MFQFTAWGTHGGGNHRCFFAKKCWATRRRARVWSLRNSVRFRECEEHSSRIHLRLLTSVGELQTANRRWGYGCQDASWAATASSRRKACPLGARWKGGRALPPLATSSACFPLCSRRSKAGRSLRLSWRGAKKRRGGNKKRCRADRPPGRWEQKSIVA